ncbi:MAG: T9SS type A sorting domain-containing protein [Chitinispirillales bacterium]|jgi:hypothetical protein|nr:T9SS type A sorting domain-containing protein [Chitinispirillales bacterium]
MPFKPVKAVKVAVAVMFVTAATAFSQLLPYPSTMPRVSDGAIPYDTILLRTWHGVRERNVRAFQTGMVHRPKSETPGDAVSEGISYGMFLALYSNDQGYFNSMWAAGERYMWTSSGNYYHWRADSTGVLTGTGPASDADQDIALLLIFADRLVKTGIWQPDTIRNGVSYTQRARTILSTIRGGMLEDHFLLPGFWGRSPSIINPGYFAPAFYRVFGEFEPEHKATWDRVIDSSYALINRSPGITRGLIPDWIRRNGTSTGGAGYNAYRNGDALYRDAIRVYWRLAKDYLWYGEPRAKAFLESAITFLESQGGPAAANFFEMDGSLLPPNDIERLAGGTITRSRREHSHLTTAMWASAAIGTGNVALAEKYSERLLSFYEGSYYWGNATDPTPDGGRMITIGGVPTLVPEDTLRNETYFDQFLAWFGAALLAGVTTNVWEDLKDGIPQGPPTWRVAPSITPVSGDIDASDPNKGPLRVTASLSRSVRWAATLTHATENRSITFRGSSDSISIVWYGLSETNEYMPQGFYWLTISAAGLEYRNRVWLGRPYAGNIPDILVGNRLLVDDFADGDLIPYIGKEWRTYSDGGNSVAVMRPTAASGNTRGQLEWDYDIRSGAQYPFIALDWDCGTMNLTGVDSIIIVARSGSVSPLTVPVHLIDTRDPNNYRYFADSITLTSTFQTHRLHLSSANFKQRYDGNDKNFNTVISALMGIRFHMQESYLPTGPSRSDAIIIQRMYLAGPPTVLSGLYTPLPPPPPYIAPPDGPISVKHNAARNQQYSIRRTGNTIRISLPPNLAGANASIIDIRGRVVRRETISQTGQLNITSRGLASGIYFLDVKKPGAPNLRLPLGKL